MAMSSRWRSYYERADDSPRDTLLAALDAFPEPGLAVDLGCGTGRDTAELLRRGWRTIAIDGEREAVERLLARSGLDLDRLETHVARFEDARWPPCDLVNSSFALPFCPPQHFDAVWARIVDSLRPGGRFSGQLFGDHDEWAVTRDISVQTRAGAEELLRPFDLERFDEVDEDGHTAIGEPKHWHLFQIVARKL
jgi:tellurite methyltransferase